MCDISKAISEANRGYFPNRYAVAGVIFFSLFLAPFLFLFASKFNPAEFICGALCQEGRHAESAGCVFRAECTFIWQVSHPLCLPICCSRHSAAPASAVQTPQAGWLAGWGGWVRGWGELRGLSAKLAAQGIQGTLTPAFAHSRAFIPPFYP